MVEVKSKAIKVPVKKTEQIRKKLIRKDMLNTNLKIKVDKNFTYLPIKTKAKLEFDNYKIIETNFSSFKKITKDYKKLVDVPEKNKFKLPSSYDVIGDIALIKLDEELLDFKKEIGNAILKTHKNLKTVCQIKPVSGEYRIRDIEIISGKKRTETIHKEFGLKFYIDLKKVYFSPRLANERKRISDLVKKNEVIVDMFTGIAPFPIIISKFSDPKLIYALDKNRYAIEFAKKNIKKNKVEKKIILENKDAKNIEKKSFKEEINRVIMNLPFSSYDFFEYALKFCENILYIHYYEILNEGYIKKRVKDLKKIAFSKKISLKNIKINKIKSYSPREFYICFDITAKKESNADVA